MKFLLFFAAAVFVSLSSAQAGDRTEKGSCPEAGINYPPGMFKQYDSRSQTSSAEIQRIFKDGKDTLTAEPAKMLFGLAHLEIMLNELCRENGNSRLAHSRKNISTIVFDLRQSLGLSHDMSRSKVVNLYWSTGKLLQLADIEVREVDAGRAATVKKIREAKAALKTALKKARDE